jgi:hypothetical protein
MMAQLAPPELQAQLAHAALRALKGLRATLVRRARKVLQALLAQLA